ncbi:MAG: DNA-3-methyladenine glycosylase family protein [Opitutales bacterium]
MEAATPVVPAGWTEWQQLQPALHFDTRSLAETLDGGQAFRWNRAAPASDVWQGVWSHCLARLTLDAEGGLLWSSPEPLATRVSAQLPDYLAGECDFAAWAHSLPLAGDENLRRAVEGWPDLRILRQPLGETLFAFLCSSTKQIVQIKQICEEVAAAFGPEIAAGVHALPDWSALAHVSENQLRACRLGYRARYIHETAQFLAAAPTFLDELEKQPLEEARQQLLKLPGVGPKIADCVLLFGAGRLDAFPIDTWILKALRELYGLDAAWRAAHLERFAQIHFAPCPGLAQQFLFALMRNRRKQTNLVD